MPALESVPLLEYDCEHLRHLSVSHIILEQPPDNKPLSAVLFAERPKFL
jgi:hypothetical protein